MARFLSLFFFSTIFSSNILIAADTPPTIVVSSIVNSWAQAGLRVTYRLFDLAIQGKGFFAVRLPSGTDVFSRYGEMHLNSEGFLIHAVSQGQVLGYCGDTYGPINLKPFARDVEGAIVKSMRVGLDGSITAYYDSGYAHVTCSVAVALFQDSSKLKRHEHILYSTPASGEGFPGLAQKEGRGSILSAALEDLDEPMYQANIKSENETSGEGQGLSRCIQQDDRE